MNGTRAILAFSGFLVAVPAFADDPAVRPSEKTAPAPDTRASSSSKNLIVSRDPETGELRPATPAEREKLLGRRKLVAAERRVVTLPDGSLMLEMTDADASYSVATRGADGKISQACVHGDAEAARALKSPPTPPAPPRADATDR